MSQLLEIIASGRKPVIGMVQLPALASGSGYRGGGFAPILETAMAEASILSDNGVDVLMIQNLGDVPVHTHATSVQVAWMTRVVAEVRTRFKRPVGINLLENDAEAMFAIASAAEADFVRIKIYVGAMRPMLRSRLATAGTPKKWRSLPTCTIGPARRSPAAASSRMSSSRCGSAWPTGW
jgi:hypothetical protein